ncbi:MAG: iron-containing alcohol dehydrogenase [Lachnospiraceae bacterium]|nr:iron-containing alcohol dehydrogenase [Lachnospiraceae bacterium]
MEEFLNQTRICFGEHALGYLKQYHSKRCFVVADPFLAKNGMLSQVTGYLGEAKVFDQVVPDPPLELVVAGIKELEAYEPQILVAVGGGSAIDAAKAIRHFGTRIAGKKGNNMSFIAIPTTSGTGSEVTSFSVITDKDKGVKYPLVDVAMRPDVAILDPELVKSVPPAITADTGMDVLTHGLEAYVSTKATPFSDALAIWAIAAVFECLPRSYEGKGQEGTQGDGTAFKALASSPGTDWEQARARMHYASCMAGMAFDAASLGLNHAIAHNIGGRFHIPHGRANAILLPYVVNFNAGSLEYNSKDCSDTAQKYAKLARQLGFGGMNTRTSVKNLVNQIVKLQKQLSMPRKFMDCGVKPEEYHEAMEQLITGAQGDACILTNPREASGQDIASILKQAL